MDKEQKARVDYLEKEIRLLTLKQNLFIERAELLYEKLSGYKELIKDLNLSNKLEYNQIKTEMHENELQAHYLVGSIATKKMSLEKLNQSFNLNAAKK